jgi:two-component system, OmpR family, alkaline phosphatase synthesis response regulator PhoP
MRKTRTKRILAVDDEEDLCEIIKFNLESEGYLVDTALSAEEALQLPVEKYHLFIFDVMMGAMSGFKLADEIRKTKKSESPIIFLTAKNTENDKLTGFSLGADDFITKPFSIRELIARVKVILRRYYPEHNEEFVNIKIQGLELDMERKKLFIEGAKVELTQHEFHILQFLMQNHGKVFSRSQILDFAWDDNISVNDRTVDVHITRLRKKLGEHGRYIISRPGHGYCFEMD